VGATPSALAVAATGGAAADDGQLPVGTTAGRYLLMSRVGAGGLGQVYAAYDPELDRKVAIKLLRAEVSETVSASQGRARLLREGQAMARLKHPNVLPVYDVGTIEHGGLSSVFVAMELVDGGTLRQWLRTSRTRKQILEVLADAARGLAAAHAAGMVHRDFKPDNILIGSDGHVFVTDFGIVRMAGTPDDASAAAPAAGDLLAVPLTSMGAMIGTPGYMPPEQYRGDPVDARTDQFSFCITLYEALTGQRPFRGITPDEIMDATLAGRITPATRHHELPAWLRRVILQGLEVDPARRHASMDALLRALAADPAVKRRRALALLGSVSLLVVAGAGLVRVSNRNHELCRGAERKLKGIWDAQVRQELERSFLATRMPVAAPLAATVSRILGDYAAQWGAMHTEACEATRVRGDQPENVLKLRMSCLDNRLQELHALTGMFTAADEPLVRKSVDAANALSPIQRCGDVAALTAPVPPPDDAATLARVDELHQKLAQLKALKASGRFKEGLVQSEALVKEARALGYGPVLAEALELHGTLLVDAGEHQKAATILHDAFASAYGSHHDAVAADTAGTLATVRGYWLAQKGEGHDWASLALAAIHRLGGNDQLEAWVKRNEAWVDYREGDGPRAIADAERALQLGKKAFDPANPTMVEIYSVLGAAYAMTNRFPEAMAANQHALEVAQRAFGPEHQNVAPVLNNLGTVALSQKRFAEAESYHRRALALQEKTLGPDHATVGIGLANLGDTLLTEKKFAEALPLFQRSLSITDKRLGKEHPSAVYGLLGLGACLIGTGHADEAVAQLERADAITKKTPLDPDVVNSLHFDLARALWDSGKDRARAVTLARQAQAALAKSEDHETADAAAKWVAAHQTASR
ncbi:MAG: tetratricopeptide repeat protein, partial [Polyangia bacterium]